MILKTEYHARIMIQAKGTNKEVTLLQEMEEQYTVDGLAKSFNQSSIGSQSWISQPVYK